MLRLMREESCVCRIRRRRYASYRGKVGQGRGERPEQGEFSADAPMTKLATDVTEFSVAGAKAYLSPVMDLFNNEIGGVLDLPEPEHGADRRDDGAAGLLGVRRVAAPAF